MNLSLQPLQCSYEWKSIKMQLDHKNSHLLPQTCIKDTEAKKRFLSFSLSFPGHCHSPPLYVSVILPPFYVSVLCQTALFIRCWTEIKCYWPVTLSDNNVLCCCQGEELVCLLFTELFPPVGGPSETFSQDLSFVKRLLLQAVSSIQQCPVIPSPPS